jgi:hypothetical protein
MEYLGEWPIWQKTPIMIGHTFICRTCPKHGPHPGAYTTVRVPTDKVADVEGVTA